VLTALAQVVPLAFASGVNLYATVAVLGLSSHYGLVRLPEQFRAFDHPAIIGAALVMYVVEFVADKIPWVDSIWDAVHTVIRPIGGALIAVASTGHVAPQMEAIVALAGAALATSSHLTKAGTRAAANTSPEPFSNWILSFTEDGFVIGLAILALNYPVAAAVVVLASLAVIVVVASWLVRRLRGTFARSRA
jgi:hypothetical protein